MNASLSDHRIFKLACILLINILRGLNYTKVFFIFSSCNGREGIICGSNFRNGDFEGLTRYGVP